MNSILSTLSGNFGRALILGHLLPAFLFVMVLLLVVQSFVPLPGLPGEPGTLLTDTWGLTAVSLFSICLAGLLYSFRLALLHLYQGYPWKDSWLGRRRIAKHQQVFDASSSRRVAMRYLRRELRMTAPKGCRSLEDERRVASLQRRRRELSVRLNNQYPHRELILPTRLGNLLRSVDAYPRRQYGISGASFFPRLRALVPANYLTAINDAEQSLVFMLNSSFLSTILLLTTVIGGLTMGAPLATLELAVAWAFHSLLFAMAALLFYSRSVARAYDWGRLVKGAFDLYRWELFDQLGYKERPTNLAEERRLWNLICLQSIHGDPPPDTNTGLLGIYRAASPEHRPATFTEPAAGLEITRGVAEQLPDGQLEIVLSVHNSSDENIPAAFVGDALPEGMEYCWASARRGEEEIKPSGVSSMRFPLGEVPPGTTVEVRYRVLPRNRQCSDGNSKP